MEASTDREIKFYACERHEWELRFVVYDEGGDPTKRLVGCKNCPEIRLMRVVSE